MKSKVKIINRKTADGLKKFQVTFPGATKPAFTLLYDPKEGEDLVSGWANSSCWENDANNLILLNEHAREFKENVELIWQLKTQIWQ